MDDSDGLGIYKIEKIPLVKETQDFHKFGRREKRRGQKQRKVREKKGFEFKNEFRKRFKLDESKFLINLLQLDGKWVVEICNRRTRKCVYQDYETLCSIMDKECRLPSVMLGFNIDVEV